MTYSECCFEEATGCRWFIAKDMNCDGVFTISDVGLWLEWAFFLPGDGLLWAVMRGSPKMATFLEITPADYGGWSMGIISASLWLLAAFTALVYNDL